MDSIIIRKTSLCDKLFAKGCKGKTPLVSPQPEQEEDQLQFELNESANKRFSICWWIVFIYFVKDFS